MSMKEASLRLEAAIETFQSLGECRRKLVGHELTAELFEELNGAERGIENLLGRDIITSFCDVSENAVLKRDILDALVAEEVSVGAEIRASLECYCEDLVRICSKYDAYLEANQTIRTKLIEELKALSKEGRDQLASTKLNFECITYTNALEVISLMNDFVNFLSSETCNMKTLAILSQKQGSDMTEEEIEFLNVLDKVADNDHRKPGYRKIDIIWGDRLLNAKVSVLGYDSKNLVEVIKALTKAEGAFYKKMSEIRELLVRETSTTDEVAIKNTRFYQTMNCIMWFGSSISECATNLSEQFALIEKRMAIVPSKSDENPDVSTDVGDASTTEA